jgi:hypothetical protein
MKGDFTRDTFDPCRHFSRVLMQQGRVQLDADWNEQTAILLHYLQALAADLIGPYGGPAKADGTAGDGFAISAAGKLDFAIGKGHYYVDGILCENDDDQAGYGSQADYPLGKDTELGNGDYLVYLDVWERHLTYVEVEDTEGRVISIREVALNGPDTATRAQVVWQVKVKPGVATRPDRLTWSGLVHGVNGWQPMNRGRLKARAINSESADHENPCITPPVSRYRGAENQLYRVEIHKGGTAKEGATFKWSRENGSVIFPIRTINENRVTVETLGRDTRLGLQVNNWVEILDDDYTLQNRAEPLLQVERLDPDKNIVTLRDKPNPLVGQSPSRHPLIRRWDQHETEDSAPSKDGVVIVEGDGDQNWIELEDNVQVHFQPGATYRTGDYWLIPARTATGDVEWPGPKDAPKAQMPHGITHHYAPLWIISVAPDGTVTADPAMDCRRHFDLTWPAP